MTGAGRYLYAVTRAQAAGGLTGTGLRGAPLRSLEHRGLVAVVSDVDLEEFGEQGLKQNLEDLAWLEEVARTHDMVIRLVAASGTVAPFRLATICVGDEGVRARLEEWHDQLDASLARVEGRMEWSVKAFAVGSQDGGRVPQSTEPGSGAAYLRQKRESARRRQELGEQAGVHAEQVHAAVCELADASRRLAAQDPRLTGRSEAMVLNGAYLVPASAGAAFTAAVQDLAGRYPDLDIDVQGPWPPYSFTTLEHG
jgi:hypothetical protein